MGQHDSVEDAFFNYRGDECKYLFLLTFLFREIHVAPQSTGATALANDTVGTMYVGEVDGAARVQKFLRYGAMAYSGTGSAEVGKYQQSKNGTH